MKTIIAESRQDKAKILLGSNTPVGVVNSRMYGDCVFLQGLEQQAKTDGWDSIYVGMKDKGEQVICDNQERYIAYVTEFTLTPNISELATIPIAKLKEMMSPWKDVAY